MLTKWVADRKTAALAAAAAASPGGEVQVTGDVEVLRPEAFTWDDDQALLTGACEQLVSETARFIGRWPTSAITAWAALRDQMPVWPAKRDAACTAIAERIHAAVTANGIYLGEPDKWPYDPTEMTEALARIRGEVRAVPALPAPHAA